MKDSSVVSVSHLLFADDSIVFVGKRRSTWIMLVLFKANLGKPMFERVLLFQLVEFRTLIDGLIVELMFFLRPILGLL